MKEELLKKLKDYFESRQDVSFAYLFGSTVSKNTHSESDIDIGIYFTPKTKELEYESDREYQNEDIIWSDLEKITKKKDRLGCAKSGAINLGLFCFAKWPKNLCQR